MIMDAQQMRQKQLWWCQDALSSKPVESPVAGRRSRGESRRKHNRDVMASKDAHAMSPLPYLRYGKFDRDRLPGLGESLPVDQATSACCCRALIGEAKDFTELRCHAAFQRPAEAANRWGRAADRLVTPRGEMPSANSTLVVTIKPQQRLQTTMVTHLHRVKSDACMESGHRASRCTRSV